MMMMADSMYEIEKKFGVKCLHNEIKVILYLSKFGPSPSLSIQHDLNRSISAHNSDLKRLKSLGFIDYEFSKEDKRVRLYFLTEKGRSLINPNDFNIGQAIFADNQSMLSESFR